ncbi:Uma2 family endonuclease [Candidatus Entotheonella palauensis]|uniref:Uma2 family endonuclease n=1 Tax=Candidatus Entotheonella palauensis TaxID=93172 RepID=UPI0021182A7B|nr:Uma2 family endonuclease [Candidatus Entotheonella palauensis]
MMMATEQQIKAFTLPAQTDPPRSPRETLPTMYDLPSEDPKEPGLPDVFHDHQPQLLLETFQPPAYQPDRFFAASDLNLYYTLQNPAWYKRPDWFGVLGAQKLYDDRDMRLSYVVWQEGAAPYLVIELLSPGTEREDLGETQREEDEPPTKWEVYEQILRIPYYVVFSRYTDQVRYFELTGCRYREVEPRDQRLWLPEAGLGVGLWFGSYQSIERQWLRFYDARGAWIPTYEERGELRAEQERQRAEQERQRAEQERQRAEQEQQRAEQEHERAERLAAQLRALGIEPE